MRRHQNALVAARTVGRAHVRFRCALSPHRLTAGSQRSLCNACGLQYLRREKKRLRQEQKQRENRLQRERLLRQYQAAHGDTAGDDSATTSTRRVLGTLRARPLRRRLNGWRTATPLGPLSSITFGSTTSGVPVERVAASDTTAHGGATRRSRRVRRPPRGVAIPGATVIQLRLLTRAQLENIDTQHGSDSDNDDSDDQSPLRSET